MQHILKKTGGQNFLEGAFILIAANALVKVIGAIYKIPLSNLIGKEGLGIFYVAYNIYTALFVLSTAGLPVAVSKMVSEANALGRVAEVKKIFRVSLSSFAAIGGGCTLIIWLFAKQFTQAVGNSMALYPVLVIAPALFFVSVVSTIRRYYQGLSNMVPTAVSQVIEALCKLVIGFVLAYILMNMGYSIEIVVSGAIGGVMIGTALSALYLCVKLRREPVTVPFKSDSLETRSRGQIFTDLIKIALPITVGASVLSLTNLIDMAVVMNRMQDIGFTESLANDLYGAYNMALTIFNLPQTLVVAVSISIIPAISASFARKSFDSVAKTTESALRLTALMALPCAAGLFAISEPVMRLVYFNKQDDAVLGAPMLTILSFAVIFVALVSLTNSILQAVGKVNVPVVTMIIGGIVKLVTNYTLVGTPNINIKGAPVGTAVCYGLIAVLNIIYIIKYTDIKISLPRIFLRPLGASIIMGFAAYFINTSVSHFFGSHLSAVISIFAAVPIYLILIILFKGITKEDVQFIPKGEKLAKILKIK